MSEILETPKRDVLVKMLSLKGKEKEEFNFEEQCFTIYNCSKRMKESQSSLYALLRKESTEYENFEFNEEQKQKIKEIQKNIEEEDVLSCYYNIIEFLDANNEERDKIYRKEAKIIEKTMEKLQTIIEKKIDINYLREKMIDQLNENSSMTFTLIDGNEKLKWNEEKYTEITVVTNFCLINFNGKQFSFFDKDREMVKAIKRVFFKYKKEIFQYAKFQEDNKQYDEFDRISSRLQMLRYVSNLHRKMRRDLYMDVCEGTVDGIHFKIDNRFYSDLNLNKFYQNLKNELINEINDTMKKIDQTDIRITDMK